MTWHQVWQWKSRQRKMSLLILHRRSMTRHQIRLWKSRPNLPRLRPLWRLLRRR
jgi:hypothetical protein